MHLVLQKVHKVQSDLKAFNLLIGDDEIVKVADFGALACAVIKELGEVRLGSVRLPV
jgi:hypothetical protein